MTDLTKDNFYCGYNMGEDAGLKDAINIQIHSISKDYSHDIMNEILQALEFYKRYGDLEKFMDETKDVVTLVEKLKAENEAMLNAFRQMHNPPKDVLEINCKFQQENQKLKAENEELKKLLDQVPVLRGDDAKNFEEYNNREATPEEIQYMKEASKIYLKTDKEQQKLEQLKEIKKRLEELINDEDFTYLSANYIKDKLLQEILEGKK